MIDEAALLAPLGPELEISARSVHERVAAAGTVLVVLDDDPTGTQSVADLPVLTAWEQSDFEWALAQNAPAIYVLTNTRSLEAATAAARNREVVANALAAAAPGGTRLTFVSRGDSTLRGHFPLETDVIAETLLERTGEQVDAVIIVPAFPDAGRVTIGATHYLRTPGGLLPAAESEFAKDATFGYASSELPRYVEEKSGGRIDAAEVVTIGLDAVRSGPSAIAAALAELHDGRPVTVDIVTEQDLRALALGLIEAEAAGKRLLYRVGPPFVRARIGQEVRAPLTAGEVYGPDGSDAVGGLIVVGSHVALTTRQLARLREERPLERVVELDVESILDETSSEASLAIAVTEVVDALAAGDVVVHTSRVLRKTDDAEESLEISRRVSAAVVSLVQSVLARRAPRFVIAKGGITSSDVASRGLGIRHAIVRGPMLPGIVSLWEPIDGPAVGIPYIVFAGNVGDDDSLAAVVGTLSAVTLARA